MNASQNLTHRLAAILAVDVVGYTRLMGDDETRTLRELNRVWDEVFNPEVARHRGRVAKTMGDGALVEFGSAVDAVTCALAIQTAMADRNTGLDAHGKIEFRIGVNLGEIVTDGVDIFGDGVNVAARLEGQAPRGGILISDLVNTQVSGKVDVAFVDVGEVSLKNVSRPLRAWCWGEMKSAAVGDPAPPTGEPAVPSLAVLPFANMSGDPEQDYFADGLVEDIITTLSKLSGLQVIARNSTFVYKGRAVDVREVQRELGVRYVLEGSVRKAANRIRITVQLIDAGTGTHVWANRYDRALDDLFALQDEITLLLATEMQVRLTEGEQARLRYTTTSNVEAWNWWVQGLAHFRGPLSKEGFTSVRSCWEHAIALDPESAPLLAALAFVHYVDARFGWWGDRATAVRTGAGYVQRGLAIDPSNPDVHSSAGLLLMIQGRHDEAVVEARKAVDLGPGSADVATFASFVFACAGHAHEAVKQIERAIRLSPKCPPTYLGHLGNAYRLASRFEDAIAAFRTYGERSPGAGLVDLVLCHQQMGRPDDAAADARRVLAANPHFTVANWRKTQVRRDGAQLDAEVAWLAAAGLPE
ncbi:MAG: adenylate/guanylate cyclase domain-containing protein [Casimicrobiaceae bacterium]